MAQNKCCFSGRGVVSLAKYDEACSLNKDLYPLIPLGNASTFALNATVNTVNGPKNYQSASGVSECSPIETIDEIKLTMKVHCLDVSNWAKAYAATQSSVAAGTNVSQTMIFTAKGQTIPFRTTDGQIATGVTNVIGEPTTGAGTNFVIGVNGISIPDTSTLTLPVTMSITFDHDAYDLLQLLTGTGSEYRLFFDGINVGAQGNPAFAGELYRIKIKPNGLPSLIDDAYVVWDLEATVLKDACQSGSKSPYGTFNFS
jgi:hypothetical protein